MSTRHDARKLESSALHLLRRQVVQAVRRGMSQTEATRTFETSDMHFNVYCIAPGQQNPLHRRPLSDEILYFVEGMGQCVVGKESYEVNPVTSSSFRRTHPIRFETSMPRTIWCAFWRSPRCPASMCRYRNEL